MIEKAEKGLYIIHPALGLAQIVDVDADEPEKFLARYSEGRKVWHRISEPHIVIATQKEIAQTFIRDHKQSEKIEAYIALLRNAGIQGLENTCRCAKVPIPGYEAFVPLFGNQLCACPTLEKLYHRFSIFKDELGKVGYKITTVELEDGRAATVLVSEP